jgi:SAM-dependent methyltransferase
MSLPDSISACRPIKFLNRMFKPGPLGTLRRMAPLSDCWGYDRGTPTDRYYIERFLDHHRSDIRGCVLEVKDSTYTDRYGTKIEHLDIVDRDPANPHATIIADLSAADSIASDSFDCFVLTQTLQFIYDVRAAVAHAHRILRPGGVLLVTVPCISKIADEPGTVDCWRFTVASCSLLFGGHFGAENVAVRPYGNLLTAIAFLLGMAQEELSPEDFNVQDEAFPLIVGVRAIKR